LLPCSLSFRGLGQGHPRNSAFDKDLSAARSIGAAAESLNGGGEVGRILDARRRLERAIGGNNRPETERWNHYFHARRTAQFDLVIHLDETAAVQPLEDIAAREPSEAPETFPSGV
jgi:hypothetical protein